ncbi:MAG: LicD family protein [Clostridium sp.]
MSSKARYRKHPRLTEKPLILYPAGEYGRRMLRELRALGIEPCAFCDGNPDKIGSKAGGLLIKSLDCLLDEYGTEGALYLINSAYNYPQIEAKLLRFGVPKSNILSPDFYSYCDTGIILRPLNLCEEERTQMKECLLDLLCFFHKVCVKYQIPYYITSGTLLGAVRHKGFIPWDDDIDIAMFRKDYNRFYRVVKKELGDRYAIQEMPSRKNLGLRNSVCHLFGNSQKTMIMIDTFPVDFVCAYPNAFNKLQERMAIFCFHLAEKLKWYDEKGTSKWVGRFFRSLGIGIEQLCNPFVSKWLHYFIWDTPNLFSNRVYDKKLVGKRTLLIFEGRRFYAPEQYDAMLRQMFDDHYMELPPEEKRIYPHTLTELKFPERRMEHG